MAYNLFSFCVMNKMSFPPFLLCFILNWKSCLMLQMFFLFSGEKVTAGCHWVFGHVLVSVLACWQECLLFLSLRASTFGSDLIMSYHHGWKGGWQNNLLSHGSLLCAWCTSFGLSCDDVEASPVAESYFFYRHRLKTIAT